MNCAKLEAFSKNLAVLRTVDFAASKRSRFCRMGVICEFSMTFELAWEAMRAILIENGDFEANSGSPRDILRLAYLREYFDDEETWRSMLDHRNVTIHIYEDAKANELFDLIQSRYISAFDELEKKLQDKIRY